MRIKHKYPTDRMAFTDDVDPEYQAEVDRHTARREKEFRDAQRRLRVAQDRADRIQRETVSRATKKSHERRLVDALAAVELRRIELEKYQRLMNASPQSAQHRGGMGHRPVPINHGIKL